MVFNVQFEVVAELLITALPPKTETEKVTPDVVPISFVDVSVYCAVTPLHIDIIVPALAPVLPVLIKV
jgi:hypothetical protein